MLPSRSSIYLCIAILYLVVPRDLIPDKIGFLGRLDDLALALFLLYRWRMLRKKDRPQQQPPEQAGAPEQNRSAWEILGIAPGASDDEITKAYRLRMSEYHPDKVMHLGPELQKVAERETLEIQKAYDELFRSKK